jgi:hypothetical protein
VGEGGSGPLARRRNTVPRKATKKHIEEEKRELFYVITFEVEKRQLNAFLECAAPAMNEGGIHIINIEPESRVV